MKEVPNPAQLVADAIRALGKVQPGSSEHTALFHLQQALEAFGR
jgi:hypothetical protein